MTSTFAYLFTRSQGTSARLLDKAPRFVAQGISQALGYRHPFTTLNPVLKCLLALQQLQGKTTLVSQDYHNSRKQFAMQMAAIKAKSTKVKQVKELILALDKQHIAARHYHPNPKQALPLIVFFHGGGFIVGDLDTHDEACRLLAVHANAQVLSLEYPLAPEHSPAHIVQCCVAALQWAYQHSKQLNIKEEKIAVCGDSAGGNLSAVVAQKTKGSRYAPTAQFLVYPTVDLKSRYASYYKFKEGLILNDEDIDCVTEFYAQQHHVALDDPLVSPLYGHLEHVAPAFVLTSGFDILHDEGQIYAAKLKQAGVKVEYREAFDMTHGFINFTVLFDDAKQHWIRACRDFRQFWDQA